MSFESGTVTPNQMWFYGDDQLLGSVDGPAWQLKWDISKFPDGSSHTIYASANIEGEERYYSDPIENFEEHDYNYAAINSTLIMRWEYSPGSTVYVVWTRALSDFDDNMNDLAFSRDFKRLFTGDANNLFLIKASKWLNI